MKQKLLALAVLGALAGTAAAQSNITVYGVVDVGIARADASPGDSVWRMDSGVQSGSRLGFKGTEDLGGGMTAAFMLENGFSTDTGAMGGGLIFGRQAWVSLGGSFGTVRLGRQFTPIYEVLDYLDPFGTGLSGGINNVFNTHGTRMDNGVKYLTPKFGSFAGQVAYSFGRETPGNAAAGRQYGGSLVYENGPLNLSGAYSDTNNNAGDGDVRTGLFAGAYDFKVAKVHFAVAQNKSEVGSAETGKSRDMMLGLTAPVGATGTVLASYIRHDDRFGSADLDQWAVGYLHGLSKRTNLYTSYGRINNKPSASVDTSVFYAGIRHKF